MSAEARFNSTGNASRTWKLLLPSWLLSVAAHGLLLFVWAVWMTGGGGGGFGVPGDGTSEVGMYLGDDSQTVEIDSFGEDSAIETAEIETETNIEPISALQSPTEPDESPLIASLLSATPSDQAPPTAATTQAAPAGRPAGAPKSKGGGGDQPNGTGLGPGETSFFKVRDAGKRFVYVVDSSGSMTGYDAIRHAKNELLASLGNLDATQKFQIIFYNEVPRTLANDNPSRDGSEKLLPATEMNRRLAKQFTAGVQADLRTLHMPALRMALAMRPDVVFFLTDAGDPPLHAADLSEVAKLNKGQTRIHSIEFGSGPELALDNPLKKLALQNGGSYRYVDVRKLGEE